MPNQNINLVIVDRSVVNYQDLIQDLEFGTEVIVLDSALDGVEQISEVLAARSNINSLQIISHGSSGSLQLGSTVLNNNNIEAYQEQLEKWGDSLTEDGDIFLYGCNVALGKNGKAFINRLSTLTNADIAASVDLTGNELLNGDWELEYTTGLIDAPLALQLKTLEAYTGVLRNAIEVTNNNASGEGSLRAAIAEAATIPGLDTIDLSGISGQSIAAHSFIIGEDNDIQFEGAGVTINGGDLGRLFRVDGANVSFADLNLVNGLHQGENTTKGKGGGLGAGGAIFIDSDSSVIVNNVVFDANFAIGGSSSGRGGSGGRGAGIGGDGGSGGDGTSNNSGGDGGDWSGFLCSNPDSGSRGDNGASNSSRFGVGGDSAGGGGGGSD
ncbi:MAG: DUF4347 domain-containing protein, partial [Pleurocapsa sp.]